MYQQTRLSDLAPIGDPGPLPYVVENWSDAELADLDAMKLDLQFGLAGMGFWPIVVSAASVDPAKQAATGGITAMAVDASAKRWTATAAVRSLTADEVAASRNDLVAYAAAARYAREMAGITVGGAQIATDRGSQALINGAYSYVLAKPDATIRFKGVSGWVSLTADQVQAIALAVGGYVQALFEAESDIDAAIQAGTITTTAQIDAQLAAAGG